MLTHTLLRKFMNGLLFEKDEFTGLCFGYSIMWLKSHLLSIELKDSSLIHDFYDRESFILKRYITSNETGKRKVNLKRFNEDYIAAQQFFKQPTELESVQKVLAQQVLAQQVFDVMAFFQNVAIFQKSYKMTHLFGQYVPQNSESQIPHTITQSLALEKYYAKKNSENATNEPLDLFVKNLPPVRLKKKHQVYALIEKVAAVLNNQVLNPNGAVGFLISNGAHAVAVTYEPRSRFWYFMDINSKKTRIFHYKMDSEELSYRLKINLGGLKKSILLKFKMISIHPNMRLMEKLSKVLADCSRHIHVKSVQKKNKAGLNLLHVCAQVGNSNGLNHFFKKKQFTDKILESKSKNNATPLWIAAKNGYLELVQNLVQAHSNPVAYLNVKMKKYTPLQIASEKNHLDIVEWLLKVLYMGHAQGDFKDVSIANMLFTAIKHNEEEAIACLLGKDPAPIKCVAPNQLNQVEDALKYALINKKEALFKALIPVHPEPDTWLERRWNKDSCPLICALYHRDAKWVQLVLNSHSNPSRYLEMELFEGMTILMMGALSKDTQSVEVMLQSHHNPVELLEKARKDERTALDFAIASGSKKMVSLLLNYHPKAVQYFEQGKDKGQKAFAIAARKGFLKITQRLLGLYDSPCQLLDGLLENKISVLHISIFFHQPEMLELMLKTLKKSPKSLLRHLEYIDDADGTPLLLAKNSGFEWAESLLLNAHPNACEYIVFTDLFTLKDEDGQTGLNVPLVNLQGDPTEHKKQSAKNFNKKNNK